MARPVEYAPVAVCECGSAWFEVDVLVDEEAKKFGVGAISLDGAGNVIAYSGQLRCIECGEEPEMPQTTRPQLHVI